MLTALALVAHLQLTIVNYDSRVIIQYDYRVLNYDCNVFYKIRHSLYIDMVEAMRKLCILSFCCNSFESWVNLLALIGWYLEPFTIALCRGVLESRSSEFGFAPRNKKMQ